MKSTRDPEDQYAGLAWVYEQLTPPSLLTPEGNVAAFASLIEPLAPGAEVLDCACGIGLLAVGLAHEGFRVDASDASPEMVKRTLRLAREHGVAVHARVRAWEALEPGLRYDAVFCVGNSLAHARERRSALAAMAATLNPGGRLIVTSRNWERERAQGSRTETEGPVTRTWTIPDAWDAPHRIEVSVAGVTAHLMVWPFTYETLIDDLRAVGLGNTDSSYAPEVDRYGVAASGYPRP